MRHWIKILYHFKHIHPIHFWIVLIAFTLFILIICFAIWYLLFCSKLKTRRWFIFNKTITISLILIFMTSLLVGIGVYLNKRKKRRQARTYEIIENTSISNSNYIFGIDVSHYQGKINWKKVKTSQHPIRYIFIKATEGTDFVDVHFDKNWYFAKKYNYIRGAYHFYNPKENSEKQFNHFQSVAQLSIGDFPPILDVEKTGGLSKKRLREGILNWLKLAEKKYRKKPILYTGRSFYKTYLKGYVEDYPLWIASYSGKYDLKNIEWNFHQFTEKVRVKGIMEKVDGNDFNGTLTDLKNMCLQ